ncbi:MAG: hypothetical protein ACK40G_12455 [Cytophagaceae bacterium]
MKELKSPAAIIFPSGYIFNALILLPAPAPGLNVGSTVPSSLNLTIHLLSIPNA